VPPGSLASFLRQHYTTSPQMAGVLASYLISNGATAARYGSGAQAKGGRDAKSGARPASPSEAPAALGEIAGHNRKRLARPAPDTVKPAAEGQAPAEAATGHGPDDRKLSAKQGLGMPGNPGPEEAPNAAEPAKEETSGGESPKAETNVENRQESKGEAAYGETGQPEGGKPAEDTSQSANVEPSKETEAPAVRPDSVPAVTPAPIAPASPVTSASPASAAADSGREPAASTPAGASEPSTSAPAAVTASAPPQPPVAPSGPPAPPISQ
jgi:hypothetical protein